MTQEHEESFAFLDTVFVHDLVLAVSIGVWDEEHERTQQVRFSVDIGVRPTGAHADTLSSVISYDFIIDGIKQVIAEDHIQLTETFAERIAAYCLSDPRAVKVKVKVEKIDRIPGASLGCEIVRERLTCGSI